MRQLIGGVILLLCSSCGFHLRGMQYLSPDFNHVALIIQKAEPDLEPLLREQFAAFHRTITADPTHAKYWLIIENDKLNQSIASISSSTTPRQYILTYTLNFKLTKTGETIISQPIIVSRQLTINSDRILGSNDEEQHIVHEMHQAAIFRLFDQIGKLIK